MSAAALGCAPRRPRLALPLPPRTWSLRLGRPRRRTRVERAARRRESRRLSLALGLAHQAASSAAAGPSALHAAPQRGL